MAPAEFSEEEPQDGPVLQRRDAGGVGCETPPAQCVLGRWLLELLDLPHHDRDTGSERLDIDLDSLVEEVNAAFPKQVGLLDAPRESEPGASDWAAWTIQHEMFLETLEKWLESTSPYEPDRQDLAGKSMMLRHEAKVPRSFTEAMRESTGLSADFLELVKAHGPALDAMVDRKRNFRFALKGATVMISYSLKRPDGSQTETAQYVYLRTALCVHQADLDEVKLLYDTLSGHKISAPSPSLANAGKEGARLATCFTLSKPLSGPAVYDVLQESAELSFGSCGIHFHEVPKKQLIATAKLFDSQAQLSGKTNFRRPAQSIYLEPWHEGMEEFLGLKKVLGPEETVCRDIHLGLWVPDEFMRRVQTGENWPLFDPTTVTDLVNLHGDAFVKRLNEYVAQEKHTSLVQARVLWRDIIASQIECGEPSILFKDAVNRKSNVSNIGTVRGSNLCAEIVQFCDSQTTSVCCVMTVSFPAFLKGPHGEKYIDFEELRASARVLQRFADRLTESALMLPGQRAKNASKTRDLGLGGQGLADVFQMMGIDFDSLEAVELNRKLYEHLYYACLTQSAELAEKHGPYERCEGSPAKALGKVQWNLWADEKQFDPATLSPELDWDGLRTKIQKVGLRNAHVTAQPPTAISAVILGNNEGAEPFTSNMYCRSDFFGDFWVFNRHLVADLKAIGAYNKVMVQRLVRDHGSVRRLPIPDDLKFRYQTAWEMAEDGPEAMVRLSAARGPFIDQSESYNIFLHDGEAKAIEQSHMAAWEAGLKSGLYYLVMRPAREAVAVTISQERQESLNFAKLNEQARMGRMQSTELSSIREGDGGSFVRRNSSDLRRCASDLMSGRDGATYEPLLKENPDRHVLFPIQHMDIWTMYKQAISLIWSADELDYAADAEAFQKLEKAEQHVIKKVLAFFAVADGIVQENIACNFGSEVQVPEVRAMYALQSFVEEIHAETYSRLLLAIVGDPVEQAELFKAHRENSPAIEAKVTWAEQYMALQHDFAERLLAFACVEGIMFSSSFAAIFYLKYKKVFMPALTNSNELISRDEGLHRDFAVLLYKNHVRRKLPESKVHSIIKDAAEVEKVFVKEAFGTDGLSGMSVADMCKYVEMVADHLATSLGYSRPYGVENPFPWMDMLSSESKTDRFGKRNTAYRQPGDLKLEYAVTPTGSSTTEGFSPATTASPSSTGPATPAESPGVASEADGVYDIIGAKKTAQYNLKAKLGIECFGCSG
eukprot:TRINITY_DN170_c1_g3_i1.p1 TRINITY_DN170_c1_g3~~TRINITY_DN170_c1_g3_i1.p1  ORF type:complete len:1229 (-),score=280.84 TRINITY_DN170_c1_g3_i1:138-3824(-)